MLERAGLLGHVSWRRESWEPENDCVTFGRCWLFLTVVDGSPIVVTVFVYLRLSLYGSKRKGAFSKRSQVSILSDSHAGRCLVLLTHLANFQHMYPATLMWEGICLCVSMSKIVSSSQVSSPTTVLHTVLYTTLGTRRLCLKVNLLKFASWNFQLIFVCFINHVSELMSYSWQILQIVSGF